MSKLQKSDQQDPEIENLNTSDHRIHVDNSAGIVNVKPSTKELEWIYSNQSLQKGHIKYVIKFLGMTSVDKPNGFEVIKNGIRKLKKIEKGASKKMKKVELTISVEGVTIRELKSQQSLYQFPLHRISYCADDKDNRHFFAFITLTNFSANDNSKESVDKFQCFAFKSKKFSREILLTMGQAFELTRLEYFGPVQSLDPEKRLKIAEDQIKRLKRHNYVYRKRLSDVSQLIDGISEYLEVMNLKTILDVPPSNVSLTSSIDISDQSPSTPTKQSSLTPKK